jgi:PAT family beta-lactamase induction signal transducer AmpG
MGISWPVVAATQFSAYMALLNLSQTVGAKMAEPLSDLMSLRQIYLCAGLLQISLIILLGFIDPQQTRRVLGKNVENDA